MCGIAGIYATEPVLKERVAQMLSAIKYRGPDHQEVKSYQGSSGSCLTVGHARLAIVDLSADANQPFENKKQDSSLTFNGEFYNFRELKNELVQQGDTFSTNSDTEVALYSLDTWGVHEGLNRLWGMFAGAYYRLSDENLFLFKDRLGKKPLYLYPYKDALYFASEPKAILSVLDHTPDINESVLAAYFYLGYIPPGQSIFKGMWQVDAGSYLQIKPNLSITTKKWYQRAGTPPFPPESFRATFMDAVSKRMISDVPLAAFLSGGLDSSLVVAAMSRLSSRPVETFSVRFDGPQALDESGYAKLVAKHCHTNHHEVVLDVDRLKNALPLVLDHYDEPFADSSAVPTYLVSRAAREQFTVALTGDGADEVFAGYRKYLGNYYLKKLGPYWLRRCLWKPLSHLLSTGRTNKRLELNRKIRRLLNGDAKDPSWRHVNWLNMDPFDPASLFGTQLDTALLSVFRANLRRQLPELASLNDFLAFDQWLVLQGDMFTKMDRMSMKSSLELRSPLVDHRLVEFANSLAPEQKLDGLVRKKILVTQLGSLLPREILERSKSGFEMPLGAWLRGDLRSWAEHHLFQDTGTKPWVNHQQLRTIWQRHCSGKLDCTEALWRHLVFAFWYQRIYA